MVVRQDGSVVVLHEKALSAKLQLLYSKSLFLVALNLAQSEEVGLCKIPCAAWNASIAAAQPAEAGHTPRKSMGTLRSVTSCMVHGTEGSIGIARC